MKIGIKAKLTGTVFLTTTVLLLTLAISGYLYFVRELKGEITRQQFTLISLVAKQIDDQLVQSISEIAQIAGKLDPDRLGDLQKVQDQLESSRREHRYFEGGFLLIGPDGRLIAECPPHPERRGTDWTHRDYVRETIRTGRPCISAPYLTTLPPLMRVVSTTTPIFRADGKLAGLLAGRHDLIRDDYLSSLARASVGRTGYLYIVDANRTMLMHPDKRRILEKIPANRNRGLDRALAGFEGAMENVNSIGVPGLTAFKSLKSVKWIVASHYPLTEAYAPIYRARRIFAGALALMIGLSFGTSFLMSRSVSSPLVRLTDHVKSIATRRGDDRSIALETGDELESLAEAFNGMICENDRQHQALLDDQELYKILAEFPSEFVMLKNPDESTRYISPNIQALTGYTDVDFMDDPRLLVKIIHPEDLEQWRRHMHTPNDDGVCGLDLRLVSRDGSVRWFSHACRQVVTPEGTPNGNRGSFREITKRVALERELQEQRRFLEMLLESTSTPLFVIGADHKVLFWNRALQALTGTPAATIVGTDDHWRPFYPSARPCLADLLIDGEVERLADLYATSTTHGALPGTLRGEGWFPGLGGRDRYLYFDAAPVYSPEGGLVAVVETLHDITERKLGERDLQEHQVALEEKHRELSNLFRMVDEGKREWEHTMDCIDDIVLLTEGDGRIRRCNKAFTIFIGRPFQDVVGGDWKSLFESAGLDLSQLSDQTGELHHPSSDRWFSARIYRYGTGGELVVSLHDFTHRKRVSDELAGAYSELKATHVQLLQQEKMASIGQLAAGVAHEINNPLGFISSNLGALGKYAGRLSEFIASQEAALAGTGQAPDAGPVAELRRKLKIDYVLEDIPKLIAESRDGAERVRVIVQNLKSFSRIDEAKDQATNLNECIESTITIVWNELKYKATLVRDFGELPPVACNAQQLNQVFMNLLVNAAHAIEKMGIITVRSWLEGGMACVSIRDTGCGIPEAIRNRIFEPFFTTKDVGKGTGLGLSISYEIVKRHNGSIEVESEIGAGTAFTVRIPIAPPGTLSTAGAAPL